MSKTTFASLRSWLKENLLLVITFSGVFLGVLIGIVLKPLELDNITISYIAYPGELFMRLLKLMILPLIIASLITGKNYLCHINKVKVFLIVVPQIDQTI